LYSLSVYHDLDRVTVNEISTNEYLIKL